MRSKRALGARAGVLLLGAALLGLSGCGAGVGDLSGTVTFQGKPVLVGTVMVTAEGGVLLNGAIEEGGAYKVVGVPAGNTKLAVVSQDPKTVKVASRKKEEKPVVLDNSKWFAIPEKYSDADKSGLSTTVKAGANTFNIELK